MRASVPLELPPVEAVDALPAETLPAFLAHLAALEGRVAARLATPRGRESGPDRLLRVQDAAALLGMSVDWLYRHADRLPFTVRNGRRTVRFSERGIRRYLDHGHGDPLDMKGVVI